MIYMKLKKNVWMFAIGMAFLCLPSLLLAQEFEGGFMGGLNGSQVAGDLSSGYHKLGAYLGVFARRQLTLKSGMQLEMYYIQKGARENPTEENGNFQYLLKIQYIELPLLYQYRVSNRLDISAGIAYSYFIGEPYEEANYSRSVSDTPFYKSSATFILGIEYKISDRLMASFRTNNSITPIRDHVSGAKRLFNRGQYSDVLTFGLAYNYFTPQNP